MNALEEVVLPGLRSQGTAGAPLKMYSVEIASHFSSIMCHQPLGADVQSPKLSYPPET